MVSKASVICTSIAWSPPPPLAQGFSRTDSLSSPQPCCCVLVSGSLNLLFPLPRMPFSQTWPTPLPGGGLGSDAPLAVRLSLTGVLHVTLPPALSAQILLRTHNCLIYYQVYTTLSKTRVQVCSEFRFFSVFRKVIVIDWAVSLPVLIKSVYWSPTPNVTVFGDKAFRG